MAKKQWEISVKAYVTSIGEPTTHLCVWSLRRNGFDVSVLSGNTSLAEKLQAIYLKADEDFLRIDADVIVNKHFTPTFLYGLESRDTWWWQFEAFDWLKLDIAHTTGFIKKEAIPALRTNVGRFMNDIRPETELSRISDFYNPRRFETFENRIIGLHGFKADMNRVKQLKQLRGQMDLYDFEMAERLNLL